MTKEPLRTQQREPLSLHYFGMSNLLLRSDMTGHLWKKLQQRGKELKRV